MNFEAVLIGESPAIRKLRKDIPQHAKLQRPLIIKGERGTGRGLLARLIYEASNTQGDLLTLDSRTIDDSELKNLLSAIDTKVLTYLIRDVEDLSPLQQLLVRRFLDSVLKRSSTQILVTVKKGVVDLKKEKRLADELFDLLKDFEVISIPTLMQRQDDVPLLIDHFITETCENLGIPTKSVDANTLDFLLRHEWTENVRELKSVVEKAVINSCDQFIELSETLIDEFAQLDGIIANIDAKKTFSFDKALYNLEKTLIERTLDVVGFNQCNAAEILNLSEANLRYRLKKFHIPTAKEKV